MATVRAMAIVDRVMSVATAGALTFVVPRNPAATMVAVIMRVVVMTVVVERINIVVEMSYVVMRMKYVVGMCRLLDITVIHPAGTRSQMWEVAAKSGKMITSVLVVNK
ncbi:MAG: hypothetical protein ACYSYV_08575 [Planctomycetota bacterium]|jgi:hypothetical protein